MGDASEGAGLLPAGAVDESRLPVLLVTYPEHPSPEMLDELWERYRAIARANERVAYLIDMRALHPMNAGANVRRRAADLYRRHRHELGRSAVCEARVVSSGLIRGILVAFDWIKGEGLWPCATFTTFDEAEAWIEERLAAFAPRPPI
ncbi:MAG: STAS/SEC14 domain-containing protein [Sandaracinaceae bacterium]